MLEKMVQVRLSLDYAPAVCWQAFRQCVEVGIALHLSILCAVECHYRARYLMRQFGNIQADKIFHIRSLELEKRHLVVLLHRIWKVVRLCIWKRRIGADSAERILQQLTICIDRLLIHSRAEICESVLPDKQIAS